MVENKSVCICFEGGDKAGKYTQSQMLLQKFLSKGIQTEYISYPRYDASDVGPVADILAGKYGSLELFDPFIMSVLYAYDRLRHKPSVDTLISLNQSLIIDRYTFSNMAYQCARVRDPYYKKILRDFIYNYEFGFAGLRVPDLTFFLATKDDIRLRRIQQDGLDDEYEASEALQQRVSIEYAEIAQEYKFVTVIASEQTAKEEVHRQILDAILQRLNIDLRQ